MSGTRNRETIQLSLGPTANAVTAHLLNLEGLSVTASSGGTSAQPVCDPLVTHRVDSDHQVWVPRVLLVDEAHRIQQASTTTTTQRHANVSSANNSNHYQQPQQQQAQQLSTMETAAATWSGAVQEVNMGTFSLADFATSADNVVSNFSMNSNHAAGVQQQQQQAPWLSSWQQTASKLAYSPYSQYRAPEHIDPYASQQQQQQSSSRYVDWDDMGDEPDEDEEERAVLQERQRQQQIRQWNGERQQCEEELSNLWRSQGQQQQHPPLPAEAALPQANQEGKGEGPETTSPTGPSEADLDRLAWMDYWMPPHPSPLTECTYGLPSTSAVSSLEAPPLYAFNIASNSSSSHSKIILEDLWEKLRVKLERTDACQGFSILTEGCGIYAGMTGWLLQELQQECRAAGRWVFQIADDDEDDDEQTPNATSGNQEEDAKQENVAVTKQQRSTELAMAQARVRNQAQCGLALAELSDKADVLIPLMLPSRKDRSLFRSSAELAMALETAMLPYRCQATKSEQSSTLVGWNSMSGYEEGATPTGMSLGDYLTTLQPSPRYSLLELDTVMSSDNRQRLGQILVAGTSVERDPRMRQPPSSLGAAYPGSWLLDEQFRASPGILTSLSPGHVAQQDRSLHHHYGMSACLRRSSVSDSPLLATNQQYLTSMMEGMGIRYRPETAFGLVTNQSLTQLAATGHRYGAGSYWQYLLGAGVDVPVLSVLGNTTRMYPHLHSVAKDMKTALKSSASKGYYQREVANGTLPELDDCDEALESCWDLRDVYEPPSGSGLADGDDEQYFEGAGN